MPTVPHHYDISADIMRYQGVADFSHGQSTKLGVLITNLGTPEAPTTPALRRYLNEFLSDPRVVEAPRLIWWLILHGIILRLRPRRSAKSYRKVWTEQGSPLLVHTEAQCNALRKVLKQHWGDDIEVAFAMRYGNPSIPDTLTQLQNAGVRQLLVLPLYPQYSGSTSGSTFDAIARDFIQRRWLPDLRVISHYPDFGPYIEAMATRIRRHWETAGRADRLIFSFHGVPQRYLKNGDPYHCECHKTARLLAEHLALGESDYLVTFQSRFGREPWLQPYTDETLKALPATGVRSVQVFCPGFSADCLETLEEIGVENRDYFLQAGGERYEYISALNALPEHIDALAALIEGNLAGWKVPDNTHVETQKALARAVGAAK